MRTICGIIVVDNQTMKPDQTMKFYPFNQVWQLVPDYRAGGNSNVWRGQANATVYRPPAYTGKQSHDP
jgi:hypothetical protein